jgi:hypothetical protein
MLKLPSFHPSALKSSLKHSNPSPKVKLTLSHEKCLLLPRFYWSGSLNKILVLTWRIIYIGQASDPNNDQVLQDAEMEELQAGQMKFILEVS